ncbi:MAG: malectin domain-containing carbohydrate-binding protein [Verrucomicrobiota bacterium]
MKTKLVVPALARWPALVGLGFIAAQAGRSATTRPQYYAHAAVHDEQGVIAPWYRGLNGQCDFRVRIAAETLKRYPWTTVSNAIAAYPHYVFSGVWQIASNGAITPKVPSDWANADLGQRAINLLNGWVDYYRYTGDPAAVAHVTYIADFLLDHCLTPPDHPWPGLFISAPTKGHPYAKADPRGLIQLDLCAAAGRGLLRAGQLTGNTRWLAAAEHWGDLLAARCHTSPEADPWPRYANPEDAPWKDNKQTGGVTMILAFLDELIRLGCTGEANVLLAAREAGRRYLRDKLLPAWTVNDTWGRYFWDWPNPVQNCSTTPDAASYLLNHPEVFPNWRADARNILTLFLNRSSVAPNSGGDVYSGAWAYPEANNCCGRSLWYAPLNLAPTLAQWAVQADDAWGRELAYRQLVLQTYDARESGVTEDNIEGGVLVNGEWFNIAHPLPMRWVLAALGWLPEELGASRENHLVRASAVVNSITYGAGSIRYSTFDAPTDTVEVLRLAFAPKSVLADGRPLPKRGDLRANGYTVKRLPNGDAIVSIRHDGRHNLAVAGDDPQATLAEDALAYEGRWTAEADAAAAGGTLRAADTPGATMTARFFGNQVRLIGRADPAGGLADVYLDDARQLVHLDCWNPSPRNQQVLYYRNGLAQGTHTLRIVARGQHNPYSAGSRIYVQAVQFSAADQPWHFPTGTGPTGTQRMVFGRTARQDYRDSRGRAWRPATEFVLRLGAERDALDSWWTQPARSAIAATRDPELYRYGVHGHEFWVNVTVGPGRYHARLKFAAARGLDTRTNCFSILINGQRLVEDLDVAATAGGPNRAVDLVFNDLAPRQGIIEVRLKAPSAPGTNTVGQAQAFLQALEVGPGPGGRGAKPKKGAVPNGLSG